MGCGSRPWGHSPIQAAEDGGHAHHHVSHRQRVSRILARKLLQLLLGGLISLEET